MGQRRRYLFVCTNRRPDDSPQGSCAHGGSEALLSALKSEIARTGLGRAEARACASGCLDQCGTGPNILVEPDHFFYGRVTPADVPAIVQALESGQRVERLVLTKEDLEPIG
jgi:(2Fe-2S) ferredoxin